jgi:hypothetical protein
VQVFFELGGQFGLAAAVVSPEANLRFDGQRRQIDHHAAGHPFCRPFRHDREDVAEGL